MTSTQPALVIVDVQRDFCQGGSLAVSGGAGIARGLSSHLRQRAQHYAAIVATRDWHVDPGAHFSPTPDFVGSWPPHCVAGTSGADLHPDLDRAAIQAVFDKGRYGAAYSGFEGVNAAGQSLGEWLRAHNVIRLHIGGIATDYCVRATALDAVGAGFDTVVLEDLIAGVAEVSSSDALAELRAAGVTLVHSTAV